MSKTDEQKTSPIPDLKNENAEVRNDAVEDQDQKYDPLYYCRTCANKDSFFVPIFKGEGLNHQLNTKIEKYLPINVTKDDDLPLQLCYNCASTIIAWDTLVIGCVEAEKKLNSLKNSVGKYICVDNGDSEEKVDELPVTAPENVDSDDEPLIAKKLAVTKTAKKKRSSKKDILEEKNETEYAAQPLENEADRRSKSLRDRRIKSERRCDGSDGEANETDENQNGGDMKVEMGEDDEHHCPVCLKTFFGEKSFCDDLYSHLSVEPASDADGESDTNKCRICKESLDKVDNLPQHLLSHVDPELGQIPGGKTFKKRKKKNSVSENEQQFKSQCKICGKVISRKYTMKRHLITHSGEKRFTCHHCGKQYAQESGLQRHVSVIHDGIRKYKCPICSKIFGSNFELKTHQYTHTDPRPFQCDQCGRTFICQKHLYHHRKYHHTANGLRQLCTICNRYFSSPGVLKRHHKVIHLRLKEFQCHICSAQLTTKQYLQEHLKIHTDERPEVCSFCGKTFQMAGNLRQHIKIHLEKTQICDVCGKGFTRRCHLIAHMALHKEFEQPQCEHCQRSFLLKVDLDKHLRTDHKVSGQAEKVVQAETVAP